MKMVRNVFLLSGLVFLGFLPGINGQDFKRVCYYSNWSQYRSGMGKFMPTDIDPFLCTHLIFSFAQMPTEVYELQTVEWNDLTLYSQFNALKNANPALKTLLAVGGWSAGSERFSNMSLDSALRLNFAQTTANFLRTFGFDGFDLDWEYPVLRGGRPADKVNFVLLLKDLMEEFQREADDSGRDRLLLSAAVPAGKYNIDTGYDVAELHKYLDFINLMSYDLHGHWETTVGHNSPLFQRADESGEQSYLNMAWAANYWVERGTPEEKLIIGLATYGRGFTLTNPSQYQPGSPAMRASPQGDYTSESGFYSYYEICTMAGTRYWMEDAKVPYFVTDDGLWVGYDDEQSFTVKLEWIKSKQFGGAMIWNIDLDDFRGFCPQSTRRYPLLSLMVEVLGPNEPQPTNPPPVTGSTQANTGNPVSTAQAPTTTATSNQPAEVKCVGLGAEFHRDPVDCNKYYHCWHGTPHHKSCQAGLVWNQGCPCCDFPANVDCGATEAPQTDAPTQPPTQAPTQVPPGAPTVTSLPDDENNNGDNDSSGDENGYKRVCYYSNWSQHRQGTARFVPSDIDPFLCTHLVYSFAELPFGTFELTKWENNDFELYQQFQNLKTRNPSLKTLLAVGGWTAGSKRFSDMVADSGLRLNFALTSISYLREHGFDGLDMDWEYPTLRGGAAADKQNFVLLLRELTEEFQKEAANTGRDRLLLTAAVPAGKWNVDSGYNVREIQKYLDFVNLMSYDLHGAWDWKTGHNSPLFSRAGELWSEAQLNIAWAANYWHEQGTPKNKLIVGLATYGRGFRLSSTSQSSPGSPSAGASPAGQYTGEAGFYAYYEICDMSGTRYWMDDSQVPYFVTTDGVWIGYDDVESFTVKLNWIKEQDYGGAMIWNIDLDDFNKVCSSSTRRYPLMSLMREILGSEDVIPPTTAAAPTTYTNPVTSPNRPRDTTVQPITSSTESDTTRGPTTTAPEVFTCAGKSGRYFKDEDNCDMFYECWAGIPYHRSCQHGLKWNVNCNCCDYPVNVNCGAESDPTTTSAPRTTEEVTAPSDVQTTTTTAPPPTATQTVTPSNAPTTTTGSVTIDLNFCKSKADGVHPNANVCSMYYNCGAGRTFVYTCPPGTSFSLKYWFCDHTRNVDCTGRGGY